MKIESKCINCSNFRLNKKIPPKRECRLNNWLDPLSLNECVKFSVDESRFKECGCGVMAFYLEKTKPKTIGDLTPFPHCATHDSWFATCKSCLFKLKK